MHTLPKNAEYLGDGLYVAHDGCQIWLIAYNGLDVLASLALEPATYKSLRKYARKFEGFEK